MITLLSMILPTIIILLPCVLYVIFRLIIKNQIISGNDKFVLLATNNGVSSKWCNWEVGIADPHKLTPKKLALLPLADNSGTWNGTEYLQIYPRIEKNAFSTSGSGYLVYYPNGTYETLETWLRR